MSTSLVSRTPNALQSISGYGAISEPLPDRSIGKGHLSGSRVGLDWDPSWVRHDGPFDGCTTCIMSYLWGVFTGGHPYACASECKHNANYEGRCVELIRYRLPPLKHMRIPCQNRPGPKQTNDHDSIYHDHQPMEEVGVVKDAQFAADIFPSVTRKWSRLRGHGMEEDRYWM